MNAPLGKNKIYTLMKTMSIKANLSKVYSNHCLRVTSATVLSRNNISPLDICSVTGHRNVESVKSYVQGTSDAQRFNMSNILHGHGKSATAVAPVSVSSSSAMQGSEMSGAHALAVTAGPSCSGVAPVISSASTCTTGPVAVAGSSSMSSSMSLSSSHAQNVNLERLTHSLFSGVTFAANSNPVFNINFN